MVVGTCNPSYSGGQGRIIAYTQEAEVAVSHCTPARAAIQDSTSKEKLLSVRLFPVSTFNTLKGSAQPGNKNLMF